MPASTRTAETADFDQLRRPGGFPWGHTAGDKSNIGSVGPGEHTLFQGGTGSGKTVALHLVAYSALAQGYDITVIDTVKGGGEWEWLNRDAAVVGTIPEAEAALEDHHEETARVYGILRQKGVSRTDVLDRQTRQEQHIWDRLIILDSTLENVALDVENEGSRVKRLLTEMLDFSRAAGVTVVSSLQPQWEELPARMRNSFAEQISFTGRNPGQARIESLGVQVWFASTERLTEELPAARETRAHHLKGNI